MQYEAGAVERAMKVQEVILRAMGGKISWLEAADILRVRPRTVRRMRARYERYGYDGLLDRRRGTPSPKRAPAEEVSRVLRLYREQYDGFNVRHFHEVVQRDHRVTLSYSYVKKALQEAGLVPRKRSRGRHRKRREPRACWGELLHIDGSKHQWLQLRPGEYQSLVAVLDDATKRLRYAQLWPQETAEAVMTALWAVFEQFGLPIALYSDRAGWAFVAKPGGGRVDKTKLTQVGRALKTLGVEHIPSYSPQARGRSERLNRTLQGRLVNELRVAKVRSLEAANAYLNKYFLPRYNETFTRQPRDPHSAFVELGKTDLNLVLCHQEERMVAKDNTVVLDTVRMQLAKQPGRRSCARLKVLVRRHLDQTHSVWFGKKCFGWFDNRGRPISLAIAA